MEVVGLNVEGPVIGYVENGMFGVVACGIIFWGLYVEVKLLRLLRFLSMKTVTLPDIGGSGSRSRTSSSSAARRARAATGGSDWRMEAPLGSDALEPHMTPPAPMGANNEVSWSSVNVSEGDFGDHVLAALRRAVRTVTITTAVSVVLGIILLLTVGAAVISHFRPFDNPPLYLAFLFCIHVVVEGGGAITLAFSTWHRGRTALRRCSCPRWRSTMDESSQEPLVSSP